MVLYTLKGLTFLDTTEVTPEERKEAETKGKFLVVKKPEDNEIKNGKENHEHIEDDNANNEEHVVSDSSAYKHAEPAAFLGKGKIKYDGRESEGNRFIMNQDL